MAAPPSDSVRVAGATVVAEDGAAESAIVRLLDGTPYRAPVSVTDLTEPRPAYHRRLHPVPPSPERQARLSSGRRLHDRLERLLAPPSEREVRIVRDGIVGRVDVLGPELVLEIKSTGRLPAGPDLRGERPLYVDQLAMYCALADRAEGQLLLVEDRGSGAPEVRAYSARFDDPVPLRQEMAARADAIRAAIEQKDPGSLPRCPWFGRGCEFGEAGVCGCTGQEPADAVRLGQRGGEFRELPELAREVSGRLTEPESPGPSTEIGRFREVLYPRRAFYERTASPDPGAAAAESVPSDADSGPSLYGRLRALLEEGRLGPFRYEVAPAGSPAEPIMVWQGRPALLKTSRSRWPVAASNVAERQSHYVVELGLRCAAARAAEGSLLIGYERPERPTDRVRVLHVRFTPRAPWVELLAERQESLRTAILRGDPSALPRCPAWMFDACPYRSRCGDGSGSDGPAAAR